MSTIPIQTSASFQELVQALMRQVDGNRDGVLTTDEFTAFLTKLLGDELKRGAAAPADAPAAAGGSVRLEGFDLSRPQDIQKSAKDAFAHLAMIAGTTPATKAEAERWFNQYIKPEMEKLGHKISWVKGDKFQFTNWQGTFVVDFVRGADGTNPALAWQVE